MLEGKGLVTIKNDYQDIINAIAKVTQSLRSIRADKRTGIDWNIRYTIIGVLGVLSRFIGQDKRIYSTVIITFH